MNVDHPKLPTVVTSKNIKIFLRVTGHFAAGFEVCRMTFRQGLTPLAEQAKYETWRIERKKKI